MTIRHLDKLFNPKSVAMIGASNRPRALGGLVMRNLLKGGFTGPIMPVNLKSEAVAGVLAYPDLASLPVVPDLGVISTPPSTVPEIIRQLGQKGTRAAIVLTAGMALQNDDQGRTLQDAMVEEARQYDVRILGPNCLGLMVPGIGLDASFSHLPADTGKIAFVSQSGALCTAVLDWARAHGIGFSHFISIGDCAELGFADVLDYLASDPETRAILLYIECIRQRRNFMSAARAAARNKPVLVVKAGREAAGIKAAASHTGALAGADDVYDAAIRRAGMLRVHDLVELFAAVQTLARAKPLKGDRLALMTNGGGCGVMAVDHLIEDGGKLADLSDETIAKLDEVLPPTWSRGDPVDIIGDAPGERYVKATEILTAAEEVDALLILHAPTALVPATDVAQAVIDVAKETQINILTNWVGDDAVAPARRMFEAAGIPTYRTPGSATRAFMHLVEYRRNQEMLMETPASVATGFVPATETARRVVEAALAGDRGMLSEMEAKMVLKAYGIPTVETEIADTPEEAATIAQEIGFPVALKILSPDITHKSDVGGVRLSLDTPEAIQAAAEGMLRTVATEMPGAEIHGFTVQRMALRPDAQELIVGITTDSIFGPVILFGHGGTAVEVIADRAVGLPPLNMSLARDQVSRTRIYRLLQGYRDRPPADLDAICLTLVQVSQMIVDIPEIVELDINPLFADEHGVLAVDARIGVLPAATLTEQRLAIRPYPKELEEAFTMASGRQVLLRPIRPEDEPEHLEFHSKLTPEDIRFRHFGMVKDLPHSEMARFTQIDYDREMAFIASAPREGGGHETLGVVRAVSDPNNERAELAIIVRSDLKGQRLGWKLLNKIIEYCRSRGTKELAAQVLPDNKRMLEFARSLGFETRAVAEENILEVTLEL